MYRLMVIMLALAVTLPIAYKSRQSVQGSAPAAFFEQSAAAPTIVRICGDVRHPGIYRLDANMLTADAILLAVPLQPLNSVTTHGAGRGKPVNGADIRVTHNHDGSTELHSGMIPVAQRMVLGVPLDINIIDVTDFERLPGVGPVLAQRIIMYRQKNGAFGSPEELLLVEGIGEIKYNNLKRYFK